MTNDQKTAEIGNFDAIRVEYDIINLISPGLLFFEFLSLGGAQKAPPIDLE